MPIRHKARSAGKASAPIPGMYKDALKRIVIISDGTGKTARRLMDAVLAQYEHHDVDYSLVRTYQEVRTRKQFDDILAEIENDYLVIYSVISKDLGRYLAHKLSELGILHLSVLYPMITTMSKFLGVHPEYEPGKLQRIDDRYYKKVDAIGFTVEHDDGLGQMIAQADIVLLGLSRTCKTPIAMYLACNHGMKVANIPIVSDSDMESSLRRRLKPVAQDKIFGLMMQAEVLAHVREERSQYLARVSAHHMEMEAYYDIQEVVSEIRFCRNLFAKYNWRTVDVTRRAIEEISLEILETLGAPDLEG